MQRLRPGLTQEWMESLWVRRPMPSHKNRPGACLARLVQKPLYLASSDFRGRPNPLPAFLLGRGLLIITYQNISVEQNEYY